MSTASPPPVDAVPPGVLAGVLLRSFLVQSAWNYKTLQGTGMAFALLPLLRHLHGEGPELERAVARHTGSFNAHPYLSSLALGSLARLEAEGAPPEVVSRFRVALGGPLGALGDRLVWADWLPLCATLAVALAWAGASPLWIVLFFLVLYNAGHLALRIWGFQAGWRSGTGISGRLREAGLGRLATRVEAWLAGALGLVTGLIVVRGGAAAPGGGGPALDLVWSGVVTLAVALGFLAGPRAWRPAAAVTVAVVAGLVLSGWFL